MNSYLFPVYAVIIGIAVVLLNANRIIKNIKILLAFSGAFLLALTIFELLPTIYEVLPYKQAAIFILSGILLQIILEFSSKGAEHGHIHFPEKQKSFPWLLFLSLCVHSFLEGFPIKPENDMAYGILIHKIPIAIVVTMFLIRSGYSKLQQLIFLMVFGIMTPLGTLAANTLTISDSTAAMINAIVVGIFFHISTVILFESNEAHKFNFSKLLVIVLGFVLAYFI